MCFLVLRNHFVKSSQSALRQVLSNPVAEVIGVASAFTKVTVVGIEVLRVYFVVG